MSRHSVSRAATLALVAGLSASLTPLTGATATAAAADTTALPADFTDQVVFSNLTSPTKMAFAPDGRVFVAQKDGRVMAYSGLTDTTPTTVADLRTQVYDYASLGLFGLALDPNFPADPWIYLSYSYDGVIGGPAPRYHDTCTLPGGCHSSARVSRLRISGEVATGSEQVLVHDWCTPSDGRSIGDLGFGPDGALYVGGGEGAWNAVDYGQLGIPTNPCADPPMPAGGAMSPPAAEGGALRAQDVRTPADPTGLGGTLIRIDRATGGAMPDNPMAGDPDPNTRRIVAYGLRNPYRWTFRPGTSEIWVGDIGWNTWDELNLVANPADGPLRNFGWPCYEGPDPQPDFRAAGLNLCASLYADPANTVTAPRYSYRHGQPVNPADGCVSTRGAVTGMVYYPGTGGHYPDRYSGVLFFADYVRRCVWGVKPGADGAPDFGSFVPLGSMVGQPADLQVGPDGNLYYADVHGGAVRRLQYQ